MGSVISGVTVIRYLMLRGSPVGKQMVLGGGPNASGANSQLAIASKELWQERVRGSSRLVDVLRSRKGCVLEEMMQIRK